MRCRWTRSNGIRTPAAESSLGRRAARLHAGASASRLDLLEQRGLVRGRGRRDPPARLRQDALRLRARAGARRARPISASRASGCSMAAERGAEVATFQGATFFRALARGQVYGTIGRTLVLRPGEQRGEEIPALPRLLDRTPLAGRDRHRHARADRRESATAGRAHDSEARDITINDVEVTLFARQQLENVGFGGMMANYTFGPQRRRIMDEVRPAAYEASACRCGPERMSGSIARSTIPRRCRYRPSSTIIRAASAWCSATATSAPSRMTTSASNCGPASGGAARRLGPGRGAAARSADRRRGQRQHHLPLAPAPAAPGRIETTLAYRQHWCWQPPEAPPVAVARQTRQGRGSGGRRRRFFVTSSATRWPIRP